MATTESAGSMARCQGNGLIEEEQRCPAFRSCKRPAPTAKFHLAGYPKRRTMMTHDLFVIIYDATAIPGE
jgi:hypothetical protein